MFDSLHPPLLVQPVNKEYITIFPSHEGYNTHFFTEDQFLVSYKDGWTIPLSVQQQKHISANPLLMVKDSGCVTTSSSTTTKGYAHKFCAEKGGDPVFLYKKNIFHDQSNVSWMFVQNAVVMIWLQYGNKNQYCGNSSFEIERIYYGKLLIRRFNIMEDFAPCFDKKADVISDSAKQFRVSSHQIFNEGWDVIDKSPDEYLQKLLLDNGLDCYQNAVSEAIRKASVV